MGLLSFIKDKLKRFDKSRGLNAGTDMSTSTETNANFSNVERNEETQKRDPFQKVEINQQYPFIGTVDFSIEQFLSSLQYNYEKFGKIRSYSALIGISAMDNTFEGNNQANQKAFVSKARNRCIFKKNARVCSRKRWTSYILSLFNKRL